jgi:hypothetical protein
MSPSIVGIHRMHSIMDGRFDLIKMIRALETVSFQCLLSFLSNFRVEEMESWLVNETFLNARA